MVQTVQKTVEYPQLQFLDKVFIPVVVVSGADGQTVLITDQLFGVGALAPRGLPPSQGACAGIIPRTAPP